VVLLSVTLCSLFIWGGGIFEPWVSKEGTKVSEKQAAPIFRVEPFCPVGGYQYINQYINYK
jgi:hypothetical protein